MAVNPLLFEYKGNCCAGCGLTVKEMMQRFGVVNKVFQFNHIEPEKKHREYDKLIQRVVSTEQLDELDKCVLLCNICHDVLHAQAVEAEVTRSVEFAGKVVEQKLKCQGIIDFETGVIRLFHNDECNLAVFKVGFPPEEPEFLADVELKQDGRLLKLLIETEGGKNLLICKDPKEPLLRAKRLNASTCRISVSPSFPLFKFNDLLGDAGERFWIRNGRMIVRSKNPVRYTITECSRTFNMSVAYADLRKGLEEQIRKAAGADGRSPSIPSEICRG
jgi:hypothetical protein